MSIPASDAAERAPGLSTGQQLDPRQGIAATTFDDQIKALFTDCADVLRGHGNAKGAERFDVAHALDAPLARQPRDRQQHAH